MEGWGKLMGFLLVFWSSEYTHLNYKSERGKRMIERVSRVLGTMYHVKIRKKNPWFV